MTSERKLGYVRDGGYFSKLFLIHFSKIHVVGLFSVLCLFLSVIGQAQQQGQEQQAAIRNLDVSFYHRRSPSYSAGGVPVSPVDTQRWLIIVLEYEIEARESEWTDRLTLDWHVALRGEGRPLLMTRNVTYADIQNGEHYAAMFIRPAIIRRYYGNNRVSDSDIRLYTPIQAGGSRIGGYLYPEDRSEHPQQWWNYEAPRVVQRENAMLPRNKTPFAPLNYDAFEYIAEER